MIEGLRSMITVAVVIVFGYIIFRRRVLPFFRKKKDGAGGNLPVPALPGSGDSCHDCGVDLMAFDVVSYDSLTDLSENVSLQLTRKMNYLCMKGMDFIVRYAVAGSILLVFVEWHGKE